MLVTIYKVLYPGLEQVDQYYKWNYEFPETRTIREDRPGAPRKVRGSVDCPGCGRRLTYNQVYADTHKCPGTLTPMPVRPRGLKPKLTPRQDRQHWIDYVARNDHPITFSEDKK